MFTIKRSLKKPKKNEEALRTSAEVQPLSQSNLNATGSIRMIKTKKDLAKRGIGSTQYQSQSTYLAKANIQTESEETECFRSM